MVIFVACLNPILSEQPFKAPSKCFRGIIFKIQSSSIICRLFFPLFLPTFPTPAIFVINGSNCFRSLFTWAVLFRLILQFSLAVSEVLLFDRPFLRQSDPHQLLYPINLHLVIVMFFTSFAIPFFLQQRRLVPPTSTGKCDRALFYKGKHHGELRTRQKIV